MVVLGILVIRVVHVVRVWLEGYTSTGTGTGTRMDISGMVGMVQRRRRRGVLDVRQNQRKIHVGSNINVVGWNGD